MLPMHRMSLESQSVSQTLDETDNEVMMTENNHRTRLISFNESTFTNRLEGLDIDRLKRRLSLAVSRRSQTGDGEIRNYKETMKKPSTPYRKTVQWLQMIYEKTRLQKAVPLLLLLGYTFLGGVIIYYIEAPAEERLIRAKQEFLDVKKTQLVNELWTAKQKKLTKAEALMRLRESVYWYTITVLYMDGNLTKVPPPSSLVNKTVANLKYYTEQMAQRCWEIRLEIKSIDQAKRLIEDSLELFEKLTGVSTVIKPVWTFNNALFLAITIYTTIGNFIVNYYYYYY